MLSKLFTLIFLVLLAVTAYYSIRYMAAPDDKVITTQQSAVNKIVSHQKTEKQGIVIENFWVSLVPEVAKNSAAYGSIKNTGKEGDTLIAVGSDIASITELHETKKMSSGFWGMEHVPNIELKPGATLTLKPMSYHIMLVDLVSKLKLGEQINIWIEFEHAGRIDIEAPIIDMAQ